jgi:hypothetical protein
MDTEKVEEKKKGTKFTRFFRRTALVFLLFECFFRCVIAALVLYLIFGQLDMDLSKWGRIWLSFSSMIWVIFPVIKFLGEPD